MSTNIIIFSGTTEGRILSDELAKSGIAHTVCVASEYGQIVMNENPYAGIHVGRLDVDSMKEMFEGQLNPDGLVIDATHPFAKEVTKNIKEAADSMNLAYIRVIRDRSKMEGLVYDSVSELAAKLSSMDTDCLDGNILLTTGSKDLHLICDKLSIDKKNKLYVRVLPAVESINICLDNGIEPGHIIAMQGPFSKEMNLAIMNQFNIKHLVTKESGAAGGFDEKISAAKELGVCCHIIARADEDGMHVMEAVELCKKTHRV